MGVFYVAKSGNDGTGTEDNPALPYLTIDAALTDASTSGDIVEIVDEGSYNEGELAARATNVTLKHTASSLGRPIIYGTGLASNPGQNPFDLAYTGFTLQGIEIKDYTSTVFHKNGANIQGLNVTDCFIHDVPRFNTGGNLVGTSGEPNIIKQTVMFFDSDSGGWSGPVNDGYLQMENCLLTSSATSAAEGDGNWPLLYDYSTKGTASFCTIINRGSTSKSTIRMAKVINCLVSSSNGMGIASDDQTYNLVCATGGGFAFRNRADDAAASTGSGERQIDHDDVGFVRGTFTGTGGETNAATARYFNITEAATAFGAGTAYNDIYVDITGNLRPQGAGYDIGCFELTVPWSDYGFQKENNTNNGFIIQTYNNLSGNYQFRSNSDQTYNPSQVPFSLGIKGPPNLRKFRALGQKPYKVTK